MAIQLAFIRIISTFSCEKMTGDLKCSFRCYAQNTGNEPRKFPPNLVDLTVLGQVINKSCYKNRENFSLFL